MLHTPNMERWQWCALVPILAIVIWMPGLGSFGFWDPHELDLLQDQSGSLRLGDTEFAARLPYAVGGLMVVALTLGLAALLGGTRAGVMAGVLVLSSPLVLLQSRQLMSSIGSVLGQVAIVLGAMTIVFTYRRRYQILGAVLVVGGAALAWVTAGPLLGVVPALLAAVIGVAMCGRRRLAVLGGLLVLGALFVGLISATTLARPQEFAWSALLEAVAYGAFPWVVLAPVALAQLADTGDERRKVGAVVCACWVLLSVGLTTITTQTMAAARFLAVPALSVGVGLWLDEVVRGRRRLGAGATAATVFAVLLLGRDLYAFPDRLASLHLLGPQTIEGAQGLSRFVPAAVAVGFAACVVAFAHRARPAVFASLAGCVLFAWWIALVWTPSLARQHSARHLFETHASVRSGDEPMWVTPAATRAAQRYLVEPALASERRGSAVALLRGPRRAFSVIRHRSLCSITQQVRATGGSVFLLDRSRAFALVSNRHQPGEPHVPGLERVLTRTPPQPREAMTTSFSDFELLGVDMPRGVRRGSNFEMTLYYRVVRKPSRAWKVFVHFDGIGRMQADHWPIGNACASQFWNVGDYVIDRFVVKAGNITRPTGRYRVWTGWFYGGQGTWTNMKVTRGPADSANRASLGMIRVH